MIFELVSSKTHKITEKLALDFAEMQSPECDRELRETRLLVYERLARMEQFRPCHWAKAICDEDGHTYRVNGRTTATLYSKLVGELPENYATVETYRCATLEDVGRLWATFDSSLQSRNASEINHAFRMTVKEFEGISRRVIDAVVSGISFFKCHAVRNSIKHITNTERAEFLIEYPEFVLWVHQLMPEVGASRHLCRQGPVAAMFATWNKAKGDATEFWTQVRDESGPRPSCPDRQLARWLAIARMQSGSLVRGKTADAREMYARCLSCWNAWRTKADLKMIRYSPANKLPVLR